MSRGKRGKKKSTIVQWISRAVTIVLLVLILSALIGLFGRDSAIVSFYKDEILFTPYNITGMIMIPLAPVWNMGWSKGRKKTIFNYKYCFKCNSCVVLDR